MWKFFGSLFGLIGGLFLGLIGGLFLGLIGGVICGIIGIIVGIRCDREDRVREALQREQQRVLLDNQQRVLQERREQFLKKICSAPLVLDTCTLMDLGCFFEKHECHDVLYKYREDMSLDEAHQNYFLQEKFWYCDQAIIHLYKTAHVILLLEKACKQRSAKIIIHRHVYRELQNIYNLNDKEKSPKAQRAKRLIERWQKLGIVQTYPDLEDKECGYYADDALLKYIEQLSMEGKKATLLTSDLDLRIRARDRKKLDTIQILSLDDIYNELTKIYSGQY